MLALNLNRERFIQQFPGPILVGDGAFERSPPEHHQQTAPPGSSSKILPTHTVFTIPKLRREAQARFTVGRASDSDLMIVDHTVSKTHAYLVRVPERDAWTLADAGSRNGTWVGEDRLSPQGQPVEVRPGMRVRFGDIALTLVESGAFWDRLRKT
jgi:FHA domain